MNSSGELETNIEETNKGEDRYHSILHKGQILSSNSDREREGYTEEYIIRLENKIYKLRNVCGDKTVEEI